MIHPLQCLLPLSNHRMVLAWKLHALRRHLHPAPPLHRRWRARPRRVAGQPLRKNQGRDPGGALRAPRTAWLASGSLRIRGMIRPYETGQAHTRAPAVMAGAFLIPVVPMHRKDLPLTSLRYSPARSIFIHCTSPDLMGQKSSRNKGDSCSC
jgi:hypothetical protein